MSRFELPEDVKAEMAAFRSGGPLPQRYIDLHERAARERLADLCATHAMHVIAAELVEDGWFDGMRVLQATLATRRGRMDIVWNDTNQDFMLVGKHGSSRLSDSDMA